MAHINMSRVLNLRWTWSMLLFIVFPIAGIVIQFILFIVFMAADATFQFPIMLLPFFLAFGIFFWWLWIVGEKQNSELLQDDKVDSTWFKRSMTVCCITLILSLIYVLTFDFFLELDLGFTGLANSIFSVFIFLGLVTIFASYIYNIYFTSVVLQKISKNKKQGGNSSSTMLFFIKILIFPFGIPLVNEELKQLKQTIN